MGMNERLITAKENWARARRGAEREVFEAGLDRLPPGQHLVDTWPMLDVGGMLDIPLSEWTLTVNGFVANPIVWTREQFLAEATFRSVPEFHCATGWNRFDNEWEGVSFKRSIDAVRSLSRAKFVLLTSSDCTTNPPLDARDVDDVLLAYQWYGRPITKEHRGAGPNDHAQAGRLERCQMGQSDHVLRSRSEGLLGSTWLLQYGPAVGERSLRLTAVLWRHSIRSEPPDLVFFIA